MNRILILLAGLVLGMGPELTSACQGSYGCPGSKKEFQSADLLEYRLLCNYEKCALSIADDGAWGASTGFTNAKTITSSLQICRQYSDAPETCKILDVNGESDFIKNFENPTESVQQVNTASSRISEQECLKEFRREGGRKWKYFVQWGTHLWLSPGDCDAYVSEDRLTWIGSSSITSSANSALQEAILGTYRSAVTKKGRIVEIEYYIDATGTLLGKGSSWKSGVSGDGSPRYQITQNQVRIVDRSSASGGWPKSYLEIASCSREKICFEVNETYKQEASIIWEGIGYFQYDWKSQLLDCYMTDKIGKQGVRCTEYQKIITSNEITESQPTEADKNIELEFWQSIKDSNDPDMFREYLRQFPSGAYAGLAKLKVKKLGGDTTVVNASIPNLDYGDYYALVIGNNYYQDLTNLRSAVNDAKAVSTVLEVDYGFNVKLLENASRKDILRSLKHLRETVSAKDNVLIYYAGHGYLDEDTDYGYWLPVDSERDDDSNWIATDRVVSQIKGMKAKHVMVVADSCFSGTITRAIKIEQRTPEWLSEIVKKKARTALTSGGLEPVMDTGSGNHSAFAYAFISLLEENDGVLDASQLFSKLRPKVMVNSTQTPQYGKIHMAGDDGGDFLFVRQ
jgi:hypothetical protein